MSQRFTLSAVAEAWSEVKKSRFIALAGSVDTEAAAKEFLTRHADPTASHNCWAWRIGQAYRFSDDGEPSGTAGKPILQAIDGQAFDRVVVVVTRWFGGVLLGSGGLVRAYGGAAAMALRSGDKLELMDSVTGRLACNFSDLAILQARTATIDGVQLHDPEFNDTGSIWGITMPRARTDEVMRLVGDITAGRARISFDE